MSLLAALALLLPNSALHNVWPSILKRTPGWPHSVLGQSPDVCGQRRVRLSRRGTWARCGWGRAVALTVLTVNLLGDAAMLSAVISERSLACKSVRSDRVPPSEQASS